MIPLGLTSESLDAASAERDPESLAASVRLRERFGADVAAAAVTQVMLRRRAVVKFGDAAARMFFTRDGLEQATRPAVARYRAARLAATGAQRVVDLGCGIGTDAVAFLRAGLAVVAVERDAGTAEVARANLTNLVPVGRFDVQVGAAEDLWPGLGNPGTAVFCDPARRTDRGRSWRVEDLSPGWPFLADLLGGLGGPRPAALKLGPGLAHRWIPPDVEAEWISQRGDTVELALWSGPGAAAGRRSAYDTEAGVRLVIDATAAPPPIERPRRFLYEPSGAVLRSGGLATLATELAAAALHPEIAYLTADDAPATPFAAAFEVTDVFAYRESSLRSWAKEMQIGVLEILTRGLGLDPAELRRRLRLRGPQHATVILTRTIDGPTVIVAKRRLSG